MAIKTLSAANAASLDQELMSTHGFSIDQLMELAGLSVAQAVYKVHPPTAGRQVLILCGPGNNGGDGLVAARHLYHFGYQPSVFYPKQGKSELYQRLVTQLRALEVAIVDDAGFDDALVHSSHVVDAIFGFSFSGSIREPFPKIIEALERTKVPVASVDAPSSWNIETGPPASGPGKHFKPQTLISLTAPKPLVNLHQGRHFIGGRFLPPSLAAKYDLDPPPYAGCDEIVEVDAQGKRINSTS